MIYRNTDKETSVYQVWYESLEDVLSEQISDANKDNSDSPSNKSFSMSWDGCKSLEELRDMLKFGWKEGVQKAEELEGSLKVPRLKNIRRVKKRSDFGDHVDMQMIYSGQLDLAWQKSQRENSPNQTGNAITLLVSIDENCSKSSDEMFWSGAVAIRLIDMLILTGRSVRVLAYQKANGCYTNSYGHEAIYVAKEYMEQLDVNKLMVILGLSGFFRTYGFLSILSSEFKAAWGLGRSYKALPKLLTDREPLENIIRVKKAYSKEDAQEVVNEFAINLEENINKLTLGNAELTTR